jgi:hypothetical protein
MSTIQYTFDSEDHDAWFLVDIEYHYEKPERQRAAEGRGYYIAPGGLEVFEVRVKEFEQYDDEGEIIEHWKRTAEVTDRQRELDALAYDKVVEAVDEWGNLAETMVRLA